MSSSANSDSKSKRSFNSLSSNPSTHSNDERSNKKKKKTSQKTLGMAWGPNSRSSSRSSFRNSPFSDFGSYMVVKNQKLHEQFDAAASSSSHCDSSIGKPIFSGVSIFVDGFTIPSSQELRGYMLKYGGRFENYFSRHHVTHIICSNLPESKIKNLRSFSGGLPVVKPTWVLDSVCANKLLSWVPYQLEQLVSDGRTQPKLSTFFVLKGSPVSDDAMVFAPDQVISEAGDPSLKGGTVKEYNSSDEGEFGEFTRSCIGESAEVLHENSTRAIFEESTCCDGIKFEDPMLSNRDELEVERVESEEVLTVEKSSPCRSATSFRLHVSTDKTNKEASSSTTVGHSNMRHSTLEDPNFVENYFKYSRLHFIGTWRTRYRKRFPDGFKRTTSNMNASAVSQDIAIIHVDMDCFFVSVVIRKRPDLWDKPVAVCHSDNPRGTAEISSANYPARCYGVRAGIFVREAKALCPDLVIVPYDFEAYEEVADKFYDILHRYCNKVQAVSCDEAFVDVSESEVEDPQLLASIIRKEVFETTGCTASAGIAGNMLMARLATRTAKPDGQCYIPTEKVDDYLEELPIKALPGIGHALEERLRRRQVKTCGQLRVISKESLRKEFGIKTGDMLWNYSRGIDNRMVGLIQESKSIGAEVNWGVRFNDLSDSQHFLNNLCKEVSLRLVGCGVQGRTFTLKIKKRRNDAEEPIKYMGCGDCENLSHSITVPMATDDVDVLKRITAQLFGQFYIDVRDIRGMGLQVSKLESADTDKQGSRRNSIRSWLLSASTSTSKDCRKCSAPGESTNNGFVYSDLSGPSVQMDSKPSNSEDSTLPSLVDLDIGVVESLPPEVFSEINDMYGGKLLGFISKRKGNSLDMSSSGALSGVIDGGNEALNRLAPLDNQYAQEVGKDHEVEKIPKGLDRGAGTSRVIDPVSGFENVDLMPSSLSQVDISVLQQLPSDLKVDILKLLPAHRRPEASDASLVPQKSSPFKLHHVCAENRTSQSESASGDVLWFGNPPRWVDEVRVSNCGILNIFAEIYYRSGSVCHLSSILQRSMSETRLHLGESSAQLADAASYLCELIRQYIKLKVETDIEEIYNCFCLMRRLAAKSKLFLHVYNMILPVVQASVGENYGGIFQVND